MSEVPTQPGQLSRGRRQLLLNRLKAKSRKKSESRHHDGPAASAIVRVARDRPLRLSFAQERLWFLEQYEPDSSTYNMASALRFRGELDLGCLQRSLTEVVRRHEVLRTTFKSIDGVPHQIIAPAEKMTIPLVDLRTLGAEDRRTQTECTLALLALLPFSLMHGPLLKLYLFRHTANDHVLFLNMHHIISDGWSITVLVRELTTLYEAFRRGSPSPLPELAIQYGDFSSWERQWLAGERLNKQLDYWRQKLGSGLETLRLPTDRVRLRRQTFRGGTWTMQLSKPISEGLKELTQGTNITLFMVLLSIFKMALARVSGQADIVVGIPAAGRNRSEVEGLIGFFPNTLVLRSDLSGDPTFRQILDRVRETTVGAYTHRYIPFEKLLIELKPDRDPGRHPIFQVFFNMLKFQDQGIELEGIKVEPVAIDAEVGSKFEITIYASDLSDGVELRWVYNADLFDQKRIAETGGDFERLARRIAEAPDTTISDLIGSEPGSKECVDSQADSQAGSNADSQAVFMFSGLGDHYVGMARGLYENEPVFRQVVDRCAEILEPHLELDLREVLYPENNSADQDSPPDAQDRAGLDLRALLGARKGGDEGAGEKFYRTEITHPILFTVEYALARLLIDRGLQPRAMIGFSLGEFVAACVAEVFSLEDALRLVARRAGLIQRLPAGHLLAVACSSEEVEPFLSGDLSLSAVTGPVTSVLAGPPEEIADVERRLLEQDIVCRRLQASHAFHSTMMRPIAEQFAELVESMERRPPKIAYISNVTGTWIEDAQATDPAYWVDHLCGTVLFADGIEELLRTEDDFLELGPGKSLGSLVLQHPGAEDKERLRILSTLRHQFDRDQDVAYLERTLGRLANGESDEVSAVGAQPAAAPRTLNEEILANIWRDILSLERVGIHADFFELGGHSLLAMRLLSRIRHSLGVDLPVRAIFEESTVANLARRIEQMTADSDSRPPLIERVSRDQALPVSFAQQGLWFLHQLEPDSTAYHIPVVVRLVGKLDVSILRTVLTEIVRRHEILRTTFGVVDDQPVQMISARQPDPLLNVDLSALPTAMRRGEGKRRIDGGVARLFDLMEGPLVRTILLSLDRDEHLVLVNMHHIVTDGWSWSVFIRELVALYQACQERNSAEQVTSPLPNLEIQYADYASWQRNWLSGERLEAELSFWRQALEGAPPRLELPTDRPRASMSIFSVGSHETSFMPETLDKLEALNGRQGATLFMSMMAIFQVLLSRYSSQTDVVVGTPIAGRGQLQTEPLIGYFLNMLAIRTDISGNLSFEELLGRVRDAVFSVYAHQELPFDRLVEEIRPERSLSHTPIFQTMFAMQNYPVGDLEIPGLRVERVMTEHVDVKYDLSLVMVRDDSGLRGSLQFNRHLFDDSTAGRIMRHFVLLVESFALEPEQSMARFAILRPAERHQTLVEWNHGPARESEPTLFHQLVARQAVRRPDAMALSGVGIELSYGELERRSNQLANLLRSRGVGPDVRVGLWVHRSAEVIVAFLGILKAGGAYVCLDRQWTRNRLASVFADADLALVLTDTRDLGELPDTPVQVLQIAEAWEEARLHDTRDPKPPVGHRNVAYVVFTSGSTGRPKGVAVEHAQVASYLGAIRQRMSFASVKNFVTVSTLAADLGNTMVFPALAGGGCLFVMSEDCFTSPEGFGEYIQRHRIEALKIVPSHLSALIAASASEHPERLLPGRRLILGGEASSADFIDRLLALDSRCRIFNHYGPSETTVGVLAHGLRRENRTGGTDRAPLPLGLPLAGTRTYILDQEGRPLAAGIPGQLHIGGTNLSRGYVGRAGATAERFWPDKFSGSWGERLYATGDRVRSLASGQIQFQGRVDHQVKIRGWRIELGEIEEVLGAHSGIRDTVVTVWEEGPDDQRLVAYVVPQGSEPPAADVLRAFIEEDLPEYMLPSAFVTLAELPLTANGKINRKALPPPGEAREAAKEVLGPRNPIEAELVAIWENLLGVQPIGVDDNFFHLGGSSLLAVHLMARIKKRLGRRLALAQLFKGATIEALAACLEGPGRVQPPSSLVTLNSVTLNSATLNSAGNRTPLFLGHPGGGGVLTYRELVEHLKTDQPVHGFQARGLTTTEPPRATVEEMASAYVHELKRISPEGPCCLGGWSFGGLLAYEMARQLVAQGREVEQLIVIDTGPSRGEEPLDLDDVETMVLLALDAGLPVTREDLQHLDRDGRLNHIAELAIRSNLLPKGTEIADVMRLIAVFKTNLVAARRYVPGPYDGELTLILADEVPDEMAAILEHDPSRGWSEVTTGPITLHHVSGRHNTILHEPNVSELAAVIRTTLTREIYTKEES